jgi:hypothetical protein
MKNLSSSALKSDGHPSILRHLDSRIVVLTLVNGLLYWPWRWLRVAFDAGDHHPQLVLLMLLLTLWAWAQLLVAVLNRIKSPPPR